MKVNKKVTRGGALYLSRKIEIWYFIVILFLSLFFIFGYFSYAMFTVQVEQEKAIRIVTGTLNATLTSTSLQPFIIRRL